MKFVKKEDSGKEGDILQRLDHEHIVKCYGVLTVDDATVGSKLDVSNGSEGCLSVQETGVNWTSQWEQSAQELGITLKHELDCCQELCIITEYCEHTLADILVDDKNYGEKDLRVFYKQIVRGIDYIHTNNIVHLDIKPENVLLKKSQNSEGMVAKIGDFGSARILTDTNLFRYQEAVDIFALGKLRVRMVCCRESEDQARVICKEIIDGRFVDESVPKWEADLIKKMLLADENLRHLTAKDILYCLSERDNRMKNIVRILWLIFCRLMRFITIRY